MTRMAASTGTIGSAIGVNRRLSRALAYTVAVLIAAIVIVPLVYVLLGGFRTTGQIAAKPVDLPHPWVTGNYTEVLRSGSFWREVTNSTIIAVTTTVVVVSTGACAAGRRCGR